MLRRSTIRKFGSRRDAILHYDWHLSQPIKILRAVAIQEILIFITILLITKHKLK